MGQYERSYHLAFYDAVKASDPSWEFGRSFDRSILDKVTGESVDNALVKSGSNLILSRKAVDISV